MISKMTLKEVNDLSPKEFHEIFSNVVERWPEAAIYVSALLPFYKLDYLLIAFDRYLEQLAVTSKLKIIRLHPDLAGKLAEENCLTIESKNEQASVGLDKLSIIHKQKLSELNQIYKKKFNFPFIICVRENRLETIFREIEKRVNNTVEEEIKLATDEVKKICRLRIMEIIE